MDCPEGGGKNCPTCVSMCQTRPCWGTPSDIKKLIDAGYGGRLMLDYWEGDRWDDETENINILSPAIKGYEGDDAPFWPEGECTFLTNDGLCELHHLGLKPKEGRDADCKSKHKTDLHKETAQTWNNQESQNMVHNYRNGLINGVS